MQWIKTLLISAVLLCSTAALAEDTQPKIDVNTASTEQLSSLEGIGKAKAEAIVRYRSEHGKFNSIEELKNVRGIGQSILDKNRAALALEE